MLFRSPPALEFLFTPGLFQCPLSCRNTRPSLRPTPHNVIMIPVLKGPLPQPPAPHPPAHPAGILAEHPSAAPSGRLAASAAALSAPTMPAAGETALIPAPLAPAPTQAALAAPPRSHGWVGGCPREEVGLLSPCPHSSCSAAIQLDSTPFDPEEPPGSASLLPASPTGAG